MPAFLKKSLHLACLTALLLTCLLFPKLAIAQTPTSSATSTGPCCRTGYSYDQTADQCISDTTSSDIQNTTCNATQFCDVSNLTCASFSSKTLPVATTNPSPITQKTPSAVVFIPIAKVDLDKSDDWYAQVLCGAGVGVFVKNPDPYKVKKTTNAGKDGIQFTMKNDSNETLHFQDCEFNAYGVAGMSKGDPVSIEVYTQNPGGGHRVSYGKSKFDISQNTPTPVPDIPPPCTKYIRTDNGADITVQVLKKNKTAAETNALRNVEYKCTQVTTAIGDLNTDPVSFVKSLLGFLLSIAGGIALALIIYSGYEILRSQGNPEKIEGARETITAAIIGLVFLIFSVVLLQIIGVDILHVPQFGN